MTLIHPVDIVETVRAGMQYISHYHPPDFLAHLGAAHDREASPAARAALAQILVSARMAAIGRRPMCQDTGMATVFARLGQACRIFGDRSLLELVNEGVRLAWQDDANPLRASMVADPLFTRTNTRDNTPAVLHVELVAGDGLDLTLAAKGGGSENKARFAVLNPGDDVADWAVRTVETLGAGWCPPGVIALGVGGSAEKAMLLAKYALMEPLNMGDLIASGPSSPIEELRLHLYNRINALGIGAQGLGGMTTVLDIKIATYPTHAASLPVALVPQCAAARHVTLRLAGSGPAYAPAPALTDWPQVALAATAATARRVDLAGLTKAEAATWQPGETLLLSGEMLTARDAAHRRLVDLIARGAPLPVDLAGRVIYYTGPVAAVGAEVVGPAGPTTATRMDPFMAPLLAQGLLATVGKAERGRDAIAQIAAHGAVYLVAVGGAAVLASQAIRAARVLAFADLGMEAIHAFDVADFPVTVAVSADGRSIHDLGPRLWRDKHVPVAERAGP